MSLALLNYHRDMLTDPVRMGCWTKAIPQCVAPGKVVVDLGTGTGVLAFLACAAGASRVYAIEEAPIIEVARELARRTPFADRIIFLSESSWDVRLPERVDVLIGDVFGAFGLNGNLLRTMIDARGRFLKPGGSLLPQGADLFCVPVELPDLYGKAVDCWSAGLCGFDHSAARRRAVNQMHLFKAPPEAALTEPACLGSARLAESTSACWQGSAEFTILRPGNLHGVAGWCTARWSPEISATNSPFVSERLAWSQAFFPIERPVPVKEGDRVNASFSLAAHGSWMIWNWQVAISADGSTKARFRHSTFQGELLSLQDLVRQNPDSLPRISRRGEIIHAVIELCDGSRTVAEIQKEIVSRFPDQFQNHSQAARLVSAVARSLCV